MTVATSLVDDSVCRAAYQRTRVVAWGNRSPYPSGGSGESIDVPERWLGGALIQYCAGMAAKGSFQWIERVVKAGALAQRLKVYALTDCNCRRRTQKEQKAEIMELWLELSYCAKSLSYSAKNKCNRPSGGSGLWLLLPE